MGHRRWLGKDDPWRNCKELFDGEVELQRPPCMRSDKEIDEMLKNLKECPTPGKKRKAPTALMKVWRTRSIFWDLPYWKILHTPHSLDVMHIKKNVCESLLGTLLNMPERTKDGPKARSDLKNMCIRKDLHGRRSDDDGTSEEDEEEEDMQGHRKRKRVKQNDYYCPPTPTPQASL
jgi:hypothetical protein